MPVLIVVADETNNRLLVMDQSLSSAHEMSVCVDGGLVIPQTVRTFQSRRRLYTGEYGGGRLMVIDNLKDFSTILLILCRFSSILKINSTDCWITDLICILLGYVAFLLQAHFSVKTYRTCSDGICTAAMTSQITGLWWRVLQQTLCYVCALHRLISSGDICAEPLMLMVCKTIQYRLMFKVT